MRLSHNGTSIFLLGVKKLAALGECGAIYNLNTPRQQPKIFVLDCGQLSTTGADLKLCFSVIGALFLQLV